MNTETTTNTVATLTDETSTVFVVGTNGDKSKFPGVIQGIRDGFLYIVNETAAEANTPAARLAVSLDVPATTCEVFRVSMANVAGVYAEDYDDDAETFDPANSTLAIGWECATA